MDAQPPPFFFPSQKLFVDYIPGNANLDHSEKVSI